MQCSPAAQVGDLALIPEVEFSMESIAHYLTKKIASAERNQWNLIGRGLGVHWEALDEDLSVENFLTACSRHQRPRYALAASS